ncbi:MAG TPA: hypothetical protein VM510_16250, partial [Caulifigura sp.]|nr:hypothetical protein [Caulifigura sp.]
MVPFRMVSWIQRSLGLRPRFRRIRRRKIAGLNHGAMSGHVIHLEERVLPAATTNVADMNPDTTFQNDSSNPREFTTIGTKTYYTYNTQVTNKPTLAVIDSTNGLTTDLTDQLAVRFSPNTQLTELTAFQGKLFFVASDAFPDLVDTTNGYKGRYLGKELWSYDPATGVFACITDFDGVHS